jgi:hypothetical protein
LFVRVPNFGEKHIAGKDKFIRRICRWPKTAGSGIIKISDKQSVKIAFQASIAADN